MKIFGNRLIHHLYALSSNYFSGNYFSGYFPPLSKITVSERLPRSENRHPRSLWLVLISTLQLVALLVSVMWLFHWLTGVSNRLTEQQFYWTNAKVVSEINQHFRSADLVDIRSQYGTGDAEKLNSILSATNLHIGQFLVMFDAGNGDLIALKQSRDMKYSESDVKALLWDQPLIMTEQQASDTVPVPRGRLNELVNSRQRQLAAAVNWPEQGDKIMFQAEYLPRLNAVLVVGQCPLAGLSGLQKYLHRSQVMAFEITLLIGLVSICLTVFIVTRVGQTVGNLSEGLEKIVSESATELLKTKNAVIFGLAKLAESRDNDTGEHLERIRLYVTILARELAVASPDLGDQFIHDLGLASSLHDIGKVGIPDSILLKPGKLTPEERGIMEIHTLIGGECLDAIQDRLGGNEFMSMARQIAYYHHERWDGTGYPHALKAEEIPLVARIVAVADVYDALTSKRPYKKAMSHQESRQIIVDGTGKHFDPVVVAAFLAHEEEFESISIQQQFLSDEDATSNFQRLYQAIAD